MPSVIDTKNRLNSAKSTQKVVKAMELVASSKIRRAREKALAVEFFHKTTISAMENLYAHDEVKSFLTNPKAQDKTLLIAITSDMGLCGGYNSNVMKALLSEIKNTNACETIVVGSKGVGKLNHEQENILHAITNYNGIAENEIAREIAEIVVDKHKNLEVNKVKIVYTKFINALVQEVEVIDLLDLDEVQTDSQIKPNLVVEPDEITVFSQLFKQYVYSITYTAILQSFASEHSYRRNSMESANKNSLELIEKLNLDLNRIRQALITQEISEIIGGSEALNK